MSEILMLSMNAELLPKSLSLLSGFRASKPSQTLILGHKIKEIKVCKTTTTTSLPIPIKIPSPRSVEGSKTLKSLKSALSSPLQSPCSLKSKNAFQFSPKSLKPADKQQNFSYAKSSGQSPRPGIDQLIRNSLKLKKNLTQIQTNNKNLEFKLKTQKKLQMKILDEIIREENFNKFKQKFRVFKPDDEKEAKVLKNAQKGKKSRKRKNRENFQVFDRKSQKNKKKTKILPENVSELTEDYSEQKKEISKKIKNLASRVEKLRASTQPTNERILKNLSRCLEIWQKRLIFLKFVSFSRPASSLEPEPFKQEDDEVQKIMNHQKFSFDNEEKKTKVTKSSEKITENQIKINYQQQKQLVSLKTTDLSEMNKLAEVLGGHPEIKKKFEGMIERRYSKLENLFQESMKQVLDLENQSSEYNNPEEGLQNTISEFSSSFLIQLNDVPLAANLTLEEVRGEDKEFIDSPNEGSLYSRDTQSEPGSAGLDFSSFNNANLPQSPQEEPGFPLISELVLEKDAEDLLDSLEQLVGGIRTQDTSEENLADNTLDLKIVAVQPQADMFILEDSYGSGESGSNANFSSISNNEGEVKEESRHSEKPARVIFEKFPSPFTDLYETSTEVEGFELIINRIVFTLEKDVFDLIFEEIQKDDLFWEGLPKKNRIAVRMSLKLLDDQVQTDSNAVLSAFKRIQQAKPPSSVIDSVLKVFNPVEILQIRDTDREDPAQIFDYSDLQPTSNFTSTTSFSENLFKETHNKALVDAFNEAILTSAKKKVAFAWNTLHQLFVLDFEVLMKNTQKTIVGWTQIEAGKIPTIEMLNSFGRLDEDKLQQVRQNKLAQFLIADVAESDQLWIESGFQETQVVLDISQFLFDQLCWEVFDFLQF